MLFGISNNFLRNLNRFEFQFSATFPQLSQKFQQIWVSILCNFFATFSKVSTDLSFNFWNFYATFYKVSTDLNFTFPQLFCHFLKILHWFEFYFSATFLQLAVKFPPILLFRNFSATFWKFYTDLKFKMSQNISQHLKTFGQFLLQISTDNFLIIVKFFFRFNRDFFRFTRMPDNVSWLAEVGDLVSPNFQ